MNTIKGKTMSTINFYATNILIDKRIKGVYVTVNLEYNELCEMLLTIDNKTRFYTLSDEEIRKEYENRFGKVKK
jgi:hypothetical protein